MSTNWLNRIWLAVTVGLIVIIIISSLVIWGRQGQGQSIEIIPPRTISSGGEIYVDGAVNNPGNYPLQENDSIAAILQASGGTTHEADLTQMHLYIPEVGEGQLPQRIDINRADVWLLAALPDIGNTRAQAIIQYRRQNGPFHNIAEISQVPGINRNIFEKIKHLITLAD
jgi:competence protein ComEA